MKTWRCCDAADAAVKDDKCDAGIYVCDDSLDDDVGAARVAGGGGGGGGDVGAGGPVGAGGARDRGADEGVGGPVGSGADGRTTPLALGCLRVPCVWIASAQIKRRR